MKRKGYRSHNAGFTLTELVVTIAIIGLLASIAIPSYMNHINRAHRSDGISTLSQLQLTLERCYSQNFSYSAYCTTRPAFPRNSPQGYYNITLTKLGTSTYTLSATAIGVQARDTTCAIMSVNQENVRTAIDNTGATQPSCWVR